MNTQQPILSDKQMAFVQRAASALPPPTRDAFVERVLSRLTGTPSDSAVSAATNAALDSVASTFRTPTAAIHSCTALATNSGPLSERM